MKLILNDRKLLLNDCTNFKNKLLGFMFKKNIDCALRLKCKAIHTFFMREKIDIIITDKNNKVLYVYNNFKKNRIIIKKNAYYFYELPSNLNTYKINDIIKIQ